MSEKDNRSTQEAVTLGPSDMAEDGQAIAYYERHGIDTVEHAFAVANILHIHSKVLEASTFYRHAFNLHGKSQNEYPLPQSLLQVRLLCLLKAAKKLPDQELEELESYSPVMFNYIRGIQVAWQDHDIEKSLSLINNAFEVFHSGEEVDRLYLEIALQKIRSSPPDIFYSAATGIPHKLHMYWDKNPPEEIQANIAYHQDMLGDAFTVFDRNTAAQWLYEHYGQEATDLFLQARHPAEGADILRLHVILSQGGWWIDADLRIKSVDAWQALKEIPVSCQLFSTNNFVVHNDFFGAAPAHPIITNALMTAWANMFRHTGLYIAFKTGPGVFNRAVSRAFYQCLILKNTLPSVHIDDQAGFDRLIEEYEVHYKNTGTSWHAQ